MWTQKQKEVTRLEMTWAAELVIQSSNNQAQSKTTLDVQM